MMNRSQIFLSRTLGVIAVALFAVVLMGCPNAAECYAEFQACTDGCDEAWQAAGEDAQNCFDSCSNEHQQDLSIDCSGVAEDQRAYVNCVTAAMNRHLECQVACMETLAAAAKAYEACNQACGEGYFECL